MTYEIRNNAQYNSTEIYFDGKPSEAVREALKSHKFRWHSVKRCWYGYTCEAAARAAIDEAQTDTATAKSENVAPAPTHGVKVGDLFYTSWGYEQTNVNFFQVIALVGARSCRLREVSPKLVEEKAISGMSCDRTYQLPKEGELLPAVTRSTFTEDTERGDLHRISTKYGCPSINVGKPGLYQETVRPYSGQAVYESWYY